jgi:hypothetical protein
MTTLRFLFILFLLLDVLAFAASRGVFSSDDSRPNTTEPERAEKQIRPDSIQILGQTPPTPPPDVTIQISPPSAGKRITPPPAPAQECMAWNGLGATQRKRLISQLAAAGIEAREVRTTTGHQIEATANPTVAEAALAGQSFAKQHKLCQQ